MHVINRTTEIIIVIKVITCRPASPGMRAATEAIVAVESLEQLKLMT